MLCDDCYWAKQENEEKHEHPLELIPVTGHEGAKMLFELEQPGTGRLLLSNVEPILKGPDSLSEQGIVGVFTILDSDEIDSLESLKEIYGEDQAERFETLHSGVLDLVVKDKRTGIVFYNLKIADVSNPATLSKPRQKEDGTSIPALRPEEVFSRAVIFTEERLKHGIVSDVVSKSGAVLVHCKQGRRRSPTAILAILISRGMRVHKALQLLGADYQGETDWLAGYKRHRAQWISSLSSFESKTAAQLANFRLAHPKLIKAYQGLLWDEALLDHPIPDISSSKDLASSISPNLKKRPQQDVGGMSSNPATPPAKKYKLASNSTLKPSLWASRGKK
jgi:hypothetical protein